MNEIGDGTMERASARTKVVYSGIARSGYDAARQGRCLSEGGIVAAGMNGPLSALSMVGASRDHVSCSLGDEAAILNLRNTVYYGLNPVGARVWNLVQQWRSVAEIRDVLLDEYAVEAPQCERDLLDLLEKMREQGLIEVRERGQEAAG